MANARKPNENGAVGWPDSTNETVERRRREAERGYPLYPCHVKLYRKRKHYLYSEIGIIMKTKLERISQLSKQNPDMIFTSIGHLINKEMIKDCHNTMEEKKAVGIDGVSKDMYAENLEENVDALVQKLKNKAYKPRAARLIEIPKDNGKTRPISIYCYEDKLVQEALRRVLEAVFEPMFYDEMMGFRPNRGCHTALRKLNIMLEAKPTSYVLDADIQGFFNNINHEWAIKFIESKIKDPTIIRLVKQMLKAGVMKEYQFEKTEQGSGQGSVCSPIIANIYMHYVLIWWFKEKATLQLAGYGDLIVYADDFVCCFQHKLEAERFYERLKHRMEYFGLKLEEDKSRLIEFGRFAEQNRRRRGERKPDTFTFLGFTHYCSRNRNGKFRVKRKTSSKKFAKKSREMNLKIKNMRTLPIKDIVGKLNQILTGYYHYYGITDNGRSLERFRMVVLKQLHYWLNRRSQRNSYTWRGFLDMLKDYPLVKPRIYVSIYAR